MNRMNFKKWHNESLVRMADCHRTLLPLALRREDEDSLKQKFQKFFHKRYALPFHMAAILIATAFFGVIIAKLFLVLGLENLALRYALAVIFESLIFFICIQLWLFYVSPREKDSSGSADWLEILTSSGGSHSGGFNPQGKGG